MHEGGVLLHWLRKMQGEALFPRRAAGVSRRPIGRNTEQAARKHSRRLRSLAAVFTLRRRECCRCRPGCSGSCSRRSLSPVETVAVGVYLLTSAATSLRVTFWFSGFPSLSSLTSATFSRSSADSFSSFFIACIFLIRVLSFPVQVSNTLPAVRRPGSEEGLDVRII